MSPVKNISPATYMLTTSALATARIQLLKLVLEQYSETPPTEAQFTRVRKLLKALDRLDRYLDGGDPKSVALQTLFDAQTLIDAQPEWMRALLTHEE